MTSLRFEDSLLVNNDSISTLESHVKIFMIDPHPIVRSGLRLLIENRPHWQVVGEASHCDEALEQFETISVLPNLILLDLELGADCGLDMLSLLQKTVPAARILVLTASEDSTKNQHAVAMGAMGLVSKSQTADILIRAIERVHNGELWVERALLANVLSYLRNPRSVNSEEKKVSSLTNREIDIITLIGEGLKNKQIATRLFISETTVRHHLTSIFSKLNVSDRLELVIYAYKHGLCRIEI